MRHDIRDAVVVSFAVPDPLRDQYRFREGQYLTLRKTLGGVDLRRSYSICAAVQDSRLRVAIKRVADGQFSSWANDHLCEGDVIDVMPPAGHFHGELGGPGPHAYAAFAAGSGITPVLSIIKTTLLAEPESRFTLFYGNRATSTMMFREELLALKDSYLTRLNLVFVMTREQQDSAYLNGRIDAHRIDQLVDHWLAGQDIRFWFACGPDAMPAVVEQALRARGVDRRRIRVEYFVNSATPPTTARLSLSPEHAGRVSEIIVIQDAVRRSFSMQHGAKSILEAGLAAGLDMPYSCKSGICSTCRTKLTSGEVEMDNAQALEDYEIARGYRLLCQCFPVSDRIELDYDASD